MPTTFKSAGCGVAPLATEHGFRMFVAQDDGTIQELISKPSTSTNTGSLAYGDWIKGFNSRYIGLTSVYPGTQIASTGYQDKALFVLFQTSGGDIRALINRKGEQWELDSTVVANAPLGTRLAAHSLTTNDHKFLGVIVVYVDASGNFHQRFFTGKYWSATSTVTTRD